MFDKYMIVGEEFKNIEKDGKTTGFQFGMRLPYYRGVVLSLLGETILLVDGEKIPADQMTVTLHNGTVSFDKFVDDPSIKWEFGEIGIVKVEKPGGLKAGEHKIEIRQHMEISYTPSGFWGRDEKVLSMPG